MDKRLFLLSKILAIVLLSLIIYLFSAKLVFFDENFHKQELAKTDIYEKHNNTEEIHSKLLNYYKFNHHQELVDIDMYTRQEKEHLLDVKNVVQSGVITLYISLFLFILLIIFIIYSKEDFKKDILHVFMLGGLSSILLVIPIALMAFFNFDFFFNGFHKLFFKGNYLFGLDSNLIAMYGDTFFYNAGLRIVLYIFISSLLLIFLSYSIFLSTKTKKYLNKKKK